MGRQEKLRERFLTRPADFTWGELVRLLEGFGYSLHKNKGSRRVFKGEGLPRIHLHEPHPGNIVKQCYLDDVRQLLEGENLI
jgi:predicted RNA binding protein YcfA (HicA-like mRNA interferase family)